jgi:hypothetical protein
MAGTMALRFLLFGFLFICSVSFTLLVVAISATDPQMFPQPLSNFRYGRWANFGLLAFFLLTAVGVLYIAIATSYAGKDVQFFAILATILIIFVTLTPTVHTGHELAANGLMLMLYLFFAYRLFRASSLWLFVHLPAPAIVLGCAATLTSLNFGTIQKSFIFYLVLMVNIDAVILLGLSLSLPAKQPSKQKTRIPLPRVKRGQRRWDRLFEESSR